MRPARTESSFHSGRQTEIDNDLASCRLLHGRRCQLALANHNGADVPVCSNSVLPMF
jgi:hypothetical protein